MYKLNGCRQLGALGLSAALFFMSALLAVPAFAVPTAAAQLTSRSIQISNSSRNTTPVIYKTSFTLPANDTIGGIVIDFCSNSPIVGDSCTAPAANFNVNRAATTVNNQSGITGFTVYTADATDNRIILTTTTPAAVSGAVSLELGNGTGSNGLTNPGVDGTFYGRMYTYTTSAAAQAHNTAAPAGYTDAGSTALSIAEKITVTAKVPETLNFCVYNGANCAAGGTSVALGDSNGVLSTAGPFVDKTTKFDIMSNSTGNYLNGDTANITYVYFKAALPTSGSNTLPSIGTAATLPVTGTSQFGLCTHVLTGTTSTGTFPPYFTNCHTTSQTAGTNSTGGTGTARFGFDTTAAASTYGDELMLLVSAGSATFTVAFVGNISTTQPAGVYSTNLNFIAVAGY